MAELIKDWSDGPTFERLLAAAQTLPHAVVESDRIVHWCDKSQRIGLSRQSSGAIEIFLVGEEIVATTPLVRRHLNFDTWNRNSGLRFDATRLVLPPAEYFTAAAAFLVEELLRHGAEADLSAGFSRTEPLIEMVLRRTALSEEEMLGLLGELRLLDALLFHSRGAADHKRILEAWHGHERSARDFVFVGSSVEVKVTRSRHSTHDINSLMQVNPHRSDTGSPLEDLHLVSFGFGAVGEGDGFTLPSVVDGILEKLGRDSGDELHVLFLDKVARYGSRGSFGYVHEEMRTWSAYENRWAQQFCRVYDLCDPAIKVLTPNLVSASAHVPSESISFRIELPEKLSGDLNPRGDILEFAATLLH